MQGEPRTMQANPTYVWAPGDVFDVLAERIAACEAAGIPRSRIAVDPGIGFGKTADHSTDVLAHLAMYHGLGCTLAVGASRKSFIGKLSRGEDTGHRLPGSLAVAVHAVNQGVQIVRVHDVAETRQALSVAGRLGERT
jgi:dihydropteroate synthase